MADKASFTKEEWTLLLESPMIAGMAVTAADPSGLWGQGIVRGTNRAYSRHYWRRHKSLSEGLSSPIFLPAKDAMVSK